MVWRVLVVLAFFLAITGSVYALAAANTVPPTRLDDVQVRNYVGNDALKAQDFAPPECASIRSTLQRIVYIGGSPGTPSNQSELILGTAGNDTINARGGNDCVLGGGGNDTLNGQAGNDVLIGGPGNDSFDGGPGTDICYRRFSSPPESYTNCETVLPDPNDP
jgi:Ca2+-binding RTX toxin-like protein